MTVLLGTIPLVGIALGTKRFCRAGLSVRFPCAVLSAILLLFCAGLLGALEFGVLMVYALGAVGIGAAVAGAIRAQKKDAWIPSTALAGLILLLLLSAVTTHGRQLTLMDEFSHWGLVVKNMLRLDAFGTAPGSTALFPSYPPAVSLLQYYFLRFAPAFDEGALFGAEHLLFAALLMPLYGSLPWKDWKTFLLLLGTAYLLPMAEYGDVYGGITVDGLMGMLMAFMLVAYFVSGGSLVERLVSVSLAGAVLALTKSAGALLAVLALLPVYADLVLFRREKAPGVARWKRLLLSLLPLLLVAAAALTWRAHVAASGAADVKNTAEITLPGLLAALKSPAQYQKETVVAFFDAMFAGEQRGMLSLSPASWLLVPFVPSAFVLLTEADARARKRYLVSVAALVVGYGLWLVGILVGYLLVFDPGEAQTLASFARYAGACRLGILVYVVAALQLNLVKAARRGRNAYLLLALCAVLALVPWREAAGATALSFYDNELSREMRAHYARSETFPMMFDPETDRICFLDENESTFGMAYYVTMFNAYPVPVGKVVSWRLGGPYFERDFYSRAVSCEAWAQALYESDFDYLYLCNTSDYFIETYGALFLKGEAAASDTLYRIDRAGGDVTLVRTDWKN